MELEGSGKALTAKVARVGARRTQRRSCGAGEQDLKTQRALREAEDAWGIRHECGECLVGDVSGWLIGGKFFARHAEFVNRG